MGLAGSGSEGPARAQGARRRRCGDIVDDAQRRDRAGLLRSPRPRNPHAAGPSDPDPKGFRRRVGSCCVGAPRQCLRIACVAPPCICPRGARNAAYPNFRTRSWKCNLPILSVLRQNAFYMKKEMRRPTIFRRGIPERRQKHFALRNEQ
jgi:hypothetical protein